jgi:hypothetical protein
VIGLYVAYYTPIAPSAIMVLVLTAAFTLSALCAADGFLSRVVRNARGLVAFRS